ncbi:MAG TPA: carboxypeptidase regulatory-like domain-containing protein [Pyrinomonadaceae bacterium]
MGLLPTLLRRCLIASLLGACLASPLGARQSGASIDGRVFDQNGAVVVNATVTATAAGGAARTVNTDARGEYLIPDLAPGRYVVRAAAPGFAAFEQPDFEVAPGRRRLDITLRVALTEQGQVDVSSATSGLSTDPENSAGALTFRDSELDVLPDDPDELSAVLRAMAGPTAGPGGAQISVDGFTDGGQQIPSRSSIREVRINQNPFSAENDRLGFGVIQIFTRPGTDRFRGQAFFNFTDESLNSRNPFAANRADYQNRLYGGNVSGPISARRASYFVSFERRELDENAVVNAVVLDPSLVVTPFSLALLTPQTRTSFSPRLDYQVNKNHNIVARYSLFHAASRNEGVGSFSLPERAYDARNTIQTLQFSETAVVSTSVVNEFRAQLAFEHQDEAGNDNPTVDVLGAFTGGGPSFVAADTFTKRLWLQDAVTWIRGDHTFRAGVRARFTHFRDTTQSNFAGTYTFAGGSAPALDANNQPVLAGGQAVLVPVSSIERYRRTLLFQSLGLSPSEIRLRGGGASQFSINVGAPDLTVTLWELGTFVQDDWRIRPNFTLSLGLRYEAQTNIGVRPNFAPRVAFAWAPGAANNRPPQTVVRGGFGIFYDRFLENSTLIARRYNGVNVRQYFVSDPAVLGLFPQVPTADQLAALDAPQTVRRVADDLREPYIIQTAFSVERQLPRRTTATVSFVATRGLHSLRTRNINAPLPGTSSPDDPESGRRPLGTPHNVLLYESSGRFNQRQLIVNVNSRLNDRFSLFANYTLNKAASDTDGINTLPANSYDLSTEYGRSSVDLRHLFFVGGAFDVPFGVRLSPFVLAFSGRPFNITTGRDANGDTIFNDRPAFATDFSKPGVVVTEFGAFDPNPGPGAQPIPRNYGDGPAFFAVSLTASKTLRFGDMPRAQNAAPAARPAGTAAQPAPAQSARPANVEKRYGLTFGLRVQNLFNRTNAAAPVGNLSSPLFGLSTSSSGSFGFGGGNPAAGNRRVEAQLRFTF